MAQILTDIDLKLCESAYFFKVMVQAEARLRPDFLKPGWTKEMRTIAREFGFNFSALLSALRAVRTYIKQVALTQPKGVEWLKDAKEQESRVMKAARLLRDVNIHDQTHGIARRIKMQRRGQERVLIGPHLMLHKKPLFESGRFANEPDLLDFLDSRPILEFAHEALAEHVAFACEGRDKGFYTLTGSAVTL